jgi:hypothetical protein
MCEGCGRNHAGGRDNCYFIRDGHPDANRHGLWKDSSSFKKLQTISTSIRGLEYGKKLFFTKDKLWSLVDTTQGPKRKVSPAVNAVCLDEIGDFKIDLNVLYSEGRTSAPGIVNNERGMPFSKINNEPISLLLDSGCVGADFINKSVVRRLNLKTFIISNMIEVSSIHGTEKANEAIKLKNFVIIDNNKVLKIPEITLIVLNTDGGPADVIVGHLTLKKYNAYGQLSHYFGTANNSTVGTVDREGVHTDHGRHESAQAPVVMNLQAKILSGNKATQRVHVSEILPQAEGDGDPTESLLPEDMLESYSQDTTQANSHFSFKVKGTEADKKIILALLEKHRDIFDTRLSSAKPANVEPMKMDVDYEAFKNDKRSREPPRPQSEPRKAAIDKWIAQAIADKIIQPSTATAWSQLRKA